MCLRDDFSLYYRGTYISRTRDGVRRIMFVEDVNGGGATRRDQVELVGDVYGWNNDGFLALGREVWRGDTIEPFVPESGYYKIAARGEPGYLEYIAQNRTNRKGFEPNRVMVNGRASHLNSVTVARIFCDKPMAGRVGMDMCVSKNRFYWRGEDVGSFHDGVLELREDVAYLQDYAQKQINQFMTA